MRGYHTANESLISQTQSLKMALKNYNDSDTEFTGKMIPSHFPQRNTLHDSS